MAPDHKKPVVKVRTGKSRGSVGSAEGMKKRSSKEKVSSKERKRSSKEKVSNRSIKGKKGEKKDGKAKTLLPEPAKKQLKFQKKPSTPKKGKEEDKFESLPVGQPTPAAHLLVFCSIGQPAKVAERKNEPAKIPEQKIQPATVPEPIIQPATVPEQKIQPATVPEPIIQPATVAERKNENPKKPDEEPAENNSNSGESQLIKFDLPKEDKEKTVVATVKMEPKVDYNKLKDTVQKFLNNLNTKTWKTVQKEFEFGYRKEPKDKQKDANPDTRFKITTNVPPESDFYDASKIEIPGIANTFIIAAEPGTDKKNQEDFWRMVYDSNVTNIFYLENYEDSAKTVFVPWKVGEGQDFGKMFISNKKIDSSTRFAVQTVLEVLPEGCSNSIIVRFMQCRKWPETLVASESESMHALCFFRLLKDDKGATMVICKNGVGRSAMFLMAHSICTLFNANIVVEVPDILAKVRAARWGAIQEEEQYLTIHMLVFKYIQQKFRKHLSDECDRQKTALAEHLEKIG